MRIAIAAPSSVPFRLGGAERAWNGLVRELMQNTQHQADLIKLPSPELTLLDVLGSYEAFARLDLSAFDLVITTKYPAWITFHEQHVVYLFHPLRSLYDLYPPEFPERVEFQDDRFRPLQLLLRRGSERTLLADVFGRFWELVDAIGPTDPALALPGPLARELVHFLDRVALNPRYVRRYLAQSRTVAERRDYFPPGASVEVLPLPPNLDGYSCGRFEYFFTPSRLEGNKRVDLLVKAMRHVQANVRLKIAGIGPDLDDLRALARGDDRIELLGPLSDRQLVETYANALAVPVVPRDEDYGLVTVEAMLSGKPVITCLDSGGPTELVGHMRTGLVAEPTPQSVAAAIDRLAANPQLARSLGEAGRLRAESITWQRTVTTLMRPHREREARERRRGRSKVVIASVGCVQRPRSAVELRGAHLARALAKEFDVEIVSLAPYGNRPSRHVLEEGVVETVVPRTELHAEAERRAAEGASLPADDLMAAETERYTREYVLALGRACRSADALVFSGPYLQSAAAALAKPIRLAYYAHRGEARAWEAVLPDSPEGERLVELVRSLERRASNDAAAALVPTLEDAQLLEAEGVAPERISVAPLGLDPAKVRPVEAEGRVELRRRWLARFTESLPEAAEVERLAVFLGDATAVDVDAARRLTSLAERLPGVLHVIVGCRPEDLGEAPPQNVVLTGLLSETVKQALLGAADVALVPIPSVRAARLELAECLAAGIPCVSTAAGAYGLRVEDGVHALLRELPEFPAAVRSVLDDPALAKRLSREGRALVERHYDASVAGDCAAAAVREVVKPSLRPGAITG